MRRDDTNAYLYDAYEGGLVWGYVGPGTLVVAAKLSAKVCHDNDTGGSESGFGWFSVSILYKYSTTHPTGMLWLKALS